MILFHGGPTHVKQPEIHKTRYTKDFGAGFCCTEFKQQAAIWSTKKGATGYITAYSYTKTLNWYIKYLPKMMNGWILLSLAAGVFHTIMILSKARWQTTRFGTKSTTLLRA